MSDGRRSAPFATETVLAPTGSESVALDRSAIDTVGVPQPVLLENAGRSAAQVLSRLFPSGPVVGLIGGGNNGGDALVLLRTLKAWGRDVEAVIVADRSTSDTLLHGWDVTALPDTSLGEAEWARILGFASVIVDGLLGTGVRGMPRDRQAAVIRRVNESGCPVLSIDVPSGIDSETGAVPGEAMSASVTVAFGAPKLGSLLSPARERVGRLVAVEIGFPPWDDESVTAQVITPRWAHRRLPARSVDTHKNAVGRVTIIAGQPGMGGAAVLATRAAFAGGAGLVRVCSAAENRELLQQAVPEAIYVDAADRDAVEAALDQSDSVALGPGLGTGEDAADVVRLVAGGPSRPLVVDADALNLAAEGIVDLKAVAESRSVLATPHAGEMSRLLAVTKAEVIADRVAALGAGVSLLGHAVLLKGVPSLVLAPGGRVLIDTQGTSDLAVAGMGDTLTGVCGALLAQGASALDAGAVGLYLTGRAARIAGRGVSLTPSDVIRWLPEALLESPSVESALDLPFVIFDAEAPR